MLNIGQVVNTFYRLHSNKASTLAVFKLQMLTGHQFKANLCRQYKFYANAVGQI